MKFIICIGILIVSAVILIAIAYLANTFCDWLLKKIKEK